MYLVLFNLKEGSVGAEGLKSWLNSLALRAPMSCVLIVGTHLDEIPPQEREEKADGVLLKASELTENFCGRLNVMHILAVGLRDRLEWVGYLRDAIYKCAAQYRSRTSSEAVMGQRVLSSSEAVMGQRVLSSSEAVMGQRVLSSSEAVMGQRVLSSSEAVMGQRVLSSSEAVMGQRVLSSSEAVMGQRVLSSSEAVMGQRVLSSFQLLEKYIHHLQKEVRCGARDPVMDRNELKALIRQLNLADLQEEDELREVARFLHNLGTLCHYDNHSHGLEELYFIDPQWLCNVVTTIVTTRELNPYVVNGLLPVQSIARFPWAYIEQFLTLLDLYDVALVLDKEWVLVPSMLSEERPAGIDVTETDQELLYVRHVFLSPSTTPRGFWGRLISRIMCTVSQVRCAVLSAASKVECLAVDSLLQLDEEFFPAAFSQASPTKFDPTKAKVLYWSTGLFYQDPDVIFRVETTLSTRVQHRVTITASPSSSKVTVDCGYVPNQPAKNHVVPLATMVPDLLLQDVDAGFLLEPSELEYREEEDSAIGIGGFGKVYRGKCRGRFVAIKKYWSRDEAQGELRKEAMFLQQLHHPCVVSLIGVSIFPSMALVLEEAPFGSLERPLIKNTSLGSPSHRCAGGSCSQTHTQLRYSVPRHQGIQCAPMVTGPRVPPPLQVVRSG